MEEKKYQIELTENQLRLIAECVEDCHRFMGGQYELNHMTSRLDKCCEIREGLRQLKPLITPNMVYEGSSYGWSGVGCPNKWQRKFIAETYPIYREIIHYLTVEAGLDNVYTSETLTCEEGGEPIKIKTIKK